MCWCVTISVQQLVVSSGGVWSGCQMLGRDCDWSQSNFLIFLNSSPDQSTESRATCTLQIMGRPKPTKPPKEKKASKKQVEPSTFEEFMEEGVELEEKGERYGDGEKSQRFYERAAEMYGKAHTLNKKDSDCLYNCFKRLTTGNRRGRVLFVLLQFLPKRVDPMAKLKLIDSSIDKFRRALALESKNADAMFNLGQALNTRAETVQEVEEIEDGYSQAAIAVQEAISILEEAYTLQEKELTPQLQDLSLNEPEHQHEHEHDHQHDHDHDHSHEHPPEKEAEQESASIDEPSTTVTEVIPTTAYTLIDTLVATANAQSTMGSMLANYEKSLDLFNSAKDKLHQAEQWLGKASQENTKDYQQAVVQIALQRAQVLSLLADRTMTADGQVDDKSYTLALEQLDFVTSKVDSRHCEAMCDRGDLLSQYAQAKQQSYLRSGRKLDGDASGKEVWQLFSQASKSFQGGLEIEPKNSSILRKLGDLSLIRAQLPLTVAEKNKQQLLKNAEFYYKQVLESDKQDIYGAWLGWAASAWALGNWCADAGKRTEADKIIKMWMKRGGDVDVVQGAYEENDCFPKQFVDWVMLTYFDDDEEDDDDDSE
ncbi:hypothetical protein NQZ79_g7276 [Umbelopsis isabellina]|nr:hypothetical protein NQZ79_g7276 [Umbelopsis isabellina]